MPEYTAKCGSCGARVRIESENEPRVYCRACHREMPVVFYS